LPFRVGEQTIARTSNLQRCAFLSLNTQAYDAASLRRLLPGIELETVVSTIEIISASKRKPCGF
jgi:hypothetical protein